MNVHGDISLQHPNPYDLPSTYFVADQGGYLYHEDDPAYVGYGYVHDHDHDPVPIYDYQHGSAHAHAQLVAANAMGASGGNGLMNGY